MYEETTDETKGGSQEMYEETTEETKGGVCAYVHVCSYVFPYVICASVYIVSIACMTCHHIARWPLIQISGATVEHMMLKATMKAAVKNMMLEAMIMVRLIHRRRLLQSYPCPARSAECTTNKAWGLRSDVKAFCVQCDVM